MRDGVVFYVRHGSVVGGMLWRRTRKTGVEEWLAAEKRHAVALGVEEYDGYGNAGGSEWAG